MGGFISKQIEGSFQRQQDFMLDMNKMTVERQIQMHNQMRERMAAAQIAGAREMFAWLGSFYAFAGSAMVMGFHKTKRPAIIAPLLPLTFLVGYQFDLAYGSKLNRIRSEAENILMFERDLIEMPSGLPTVSSLDMGRQKMEEESKYKAISAQTEEKFD